MRHCPNCGHLVKPTDTFCQNCGYNLTDFRSGLSANDQGQPDQNIQPNGFQQPPQQYQQPYYGRRRHNIFGIIIVVIALAVLGFGGAYAYHNNIAPFNWFNSSSSSSPSDSSSGGSSNSATEPSQSTAYNQVTRMWDRISNALDSDNSSGDSDDFSTCFAGGTGNNSYQGLNDWKNEVKGADDHNNTEVVSITPYDLHMSRQGSKSVVSYKVKYNFKIHADSDHAHNHIQVFDWTATFDGSSKISETNSPKTPEKDYDE